MEPMNDDRTPEERRQDWVRAVDTVTAHGWEHVAGWHFRSPSGTIHDLSASDLTLLDHIESEGLSVSDPDESPVISSI